MLKVYYLVLTSVLFGGTTVKSETQAGLDYRSVSYEDLLPSLEQFFDDGVGHFSELLFDSPHHQLIAGSFVLHTLAFLINGIFTQNFVLSMIKF